MTRTFGVAARLRAAGCVFADDEAVFLCDAATTGDELAMMIARREAGEPLEYVVGWAEFCGLRMQVDAGVFVPRMRTEHLVEVAGSMLAPGTVVVDLCCGSGAVGAALLARCPDIQLTSSDIDPVAIGCARRNLEDRATVVIGDMFDALPAGLVGRVDLLVVNAPYVPTNEIETLPAEARDHEARATLDGGPDGLDVQRRVIDGASTWLATSGVVIIETSELQSAATAAMMRSADLLPSIVTDPELEATVVIGRRELHRATT